MSDNKYTPKGITGLPWEMHVGWDVCGYPCFYLHGLSGEQKRDNAMLESNARYLVHAANEYPKAIDALRRLKDLLEHFEWTLDEDALAVLSRSAELEDK